MPTLRVLIEDMVKVKIVLRDAARDARTDASRKSAVIDARRQFASAVTLVGAAIEQDVQLKSNPELRAEFLKRFADMRAKVAVFQAKWPAVLLNSDDPEFDQTSALLRESNQSFILWAQKTLAK